MAIYRQIHVSFWQDGFVLELTPEEKYFYLYLMTNGKTKQCGTYEITKKIMELETGYNRETIDKLLARFIEYNKIEYCEETKEVYLHNWLKHNFSKSPKVLSCIKKEINEIKHKPFKDATIQYIYSLDTVSIQWGEEEEEEEEQEEEKEEIYAQRFTEFWLVYPKHKSKGQAEKAFAKLSPNEQLHNVIIQSLERAKTSADWAKDDGKYIPHPATWLNAKGWEDEYIPAKGKSKRIDTRNWEEE